MYFFHFTLSVAHSLCLHTCPNIFLTHGCRVWSVLVSYEAAACFFFFCFLFDAFKLKTRCIKNALGLLCACVRMLRAVCCSSVNTYLYRVIYFRVIFHFFGGFKMKILGYKDAPLLVMIVPFILRRCCHCKAFLVWGLCHAHALLRELWLSIFSSRNKANRVPPNPSPQIGERVSSLHDVKEIRLLRKADNNLISLWYFPPWSLAENSA